MQITPVERFWNKVQFRVDGCWNWLGSRSSAGYGQFQVNGKMTYVHRFVFDLLGLDIPGTMVVDHLCRNRACVNPAHLRLVWNQENILAGRGAAASNALKTHCPQGHPYDDENTWTNKHGDRYCKQCRRERYQTDHYREQRRQSLQRWYDNRGKEQNQTPERKAKQREAERRYRLKKRGL